MQVSYDSLDKFDEFDTRNIAAIAFVLLAQTVAREKGISQIELQESMLLCAFQLFKHSDPERLKCFLTENFPTIKEVKDEGDNHHSSEG
ncbi:hypothetical protein [Kamptonema formosum]|uniref:hypothetical protein n=1 Tax=Kamptonema formosum TaxID=331992 RepID=UPI000346653A|nr:hypothetical protein [Kamptonema formosum]